MEGNQLRSGYFRHGAPYICSVIVSVADTQADCVFGYRDVCGFNSDTCSKYDVMKAVDSSCMATIRTRWVYEKGKGYRMRGWSDSDEKANYYDFITFTSNSMLAYLLYSLWRKDHSQAWARERALEMTEFAIEKQLPSGAIPRCWDLDHDHAHGMGIIIMRLAPSMTRWRLAHARKTWISSYRRWKRKRAARPRTGKQPFKRRSIG